MLSNTDIIFFYVFSIARALVIMYYYVMLRTKPSWYFVNLILDGISDIWEQFLSFKSIESIQFNQLNTNLLSWNRSYHSSASFQLKQNWWSIMFIHFYTYIDVVEKHSSFFFAIDAIKHINIANKLVIWIFSAHYFSRMKNLRIAQIIQTTKLSNYRAK